MTAADRPGTGPGGQPRRELAPGTVHVPSWLTPGQQRWIAGRFYEWTRGPVPIRAATVRGHEMSVQAGVRVPPGKGRLPDEVPRQMRGHAAGVCRGFDMLGVGDFFRSAWEVIARGASGWMRDRGVITTGLR